MRTPSQEEHSLSRQWRTFLSRNPTSKIHLVGKPTETMDFAAKRITGTARKKQTKPKKLDKDLISEK
jgi:hypothetical protein